MDLVEIYTRSGCGYCDHSVALLQSHGIAFTEYNVYQNASALEALRSRTTNRTYPQVFINNRSVGGFEELLKTNLNTTK